METNNYRLLFKSNSHHGNRVTSVIVLDGDKFVTNAVVTRNNSENDNKLLAQKYALTKALRRSKLTKESRGIVWGKFFVRSKRARKLIGA